MRPLRNLVLFALAAATGFAGCKLEETNINPNVPDDVPVQTLLPPAQFNMARALGGRTFRYTNIFTQHLRGTNNQ